ncbi:(2Fe-2S)-binding protein [Desulfococcaceae bacterium HSG9]|nr:(2Fe-2S)-binding protein [Desulfococcaceae bacterium HSG9]
MASSFIFAKQVREILKSGAKEIEIPEGVRISPAALDIIRDNKIQIKTLTAQVVTAAPETDEISETPETKAEPDEAAPEEPETFHKKSAVEAVPSDLSAETTVDISEDIVEDIVNRVIDRFKRLKNLPASQTASGTIKKASATSADNLVICRCEEVTRAEIKDAIRTGMQSLNGVKRVTRAGMGLCQGQTCQRLVTQILAQELGVSPAETEPMTARGPVRPLTLAVFANS